MPQSGRRVKRLSRAATRVSPERGRSRAVKSAEGVRFYKASTPVRQRKERASSGSSSGS